MRIVLTTDDGQVLDIVRDTEAGQKYGIDNAGFFYLTD